MLTVKSKTPSYKTVRKISKECPYCKSELTETERDFFPCSCSFQACVDCYKDLMRNKKVCPSCHTQLKLERINALHASKREELSKDQDSHQPKKSDKKSTTTITVVTTVSTKASTRNDQTSVSVHHHEEVSRAGLSKMSFTELARLRVIQKNMVYVIGLAPQIAKMDVLEKFEYFGQYGKVTKIIVNKSNVYNAQGPGGPSYSAYITFSNEVEASTAILAVDECMMYERIIRASYGTTKYCTFFLRDKPCPNPACLYLHTAAKEKDCFVKDDSFSNKDIFNDQQRLALEHIHKHYQDILKKIAANSKLKSLLPSLKTVEEKVQEFIEEIERLKASTKVVEVEKIPEKQTEAPKAKPATEAAPEQKPAEAKVEAEKVERKQSDIVPQEKEKEKESEAKPEVKEESKLVKEQANITSPSNEKEEVPAKSEAKNEPNCQSHRSFSSTQSTTINSSKKEVLVDQKEDSDSRPSVKSPDSLQKEVECNIKQDDIVMEDQANPEEVKSFINLAGMFDKIDPREGENGTLQSEFNRRILDHLIRNLSSHSESRFSIAQCEDKEESDEGKTIETNVEDWDSKNEEFSFISKSIQEYLLSPASSPPVGLNVQTERFGQNTGAEESSAFGSSHYSMDNYPNFSTPTKKPVSNGNSNSKYVEQESTDLDSATTPTYGLQQNLFEKGKNVENGMIYKADNAANQAENQNKTNRRTNKGKNNKRQNKSGTKASDSPNNGSSAEVNGFYKGMHFGNGSPLLNENQISGSYFGNIGINGAEGFAISNNTAYSRVSSTL